MDEGLAGEEGVLRQGPILANHSAALGLDPRAAHNAVQAANGPRIKSEDGTMVWVAGELARSAVQKSDSTNAKIPRYTSHHDPLRRHHLVLVL